MTRRDYIIIACVFVAIGLAAIGGLVAQDSISVEGFLAAAYDSTNSALQISVVSTDSNQTVGGNLSVTGTSTLTGAVTAAADVTVTDDLTVGGWVTIPTTIVSAASYTISSTGKASGYIVEYTDTAAASIMLPDTPADGTIIFIQDGDLNAGTNNITIATEGSDTINEGATFAQNANGESTIFAYNSTNTDWAIIGGYAE